MFKPDAYTTGDIRPHSYGMAVPLENLRLRAEVYGLQGEHLGLDNPDGYTAVVPNGLGEGRNTNGLMARTLVRSASEMGIDMSVVTYDDPLSYEQASYTAAVVAVGGHVRERTQGRMLWLPHSRGGISLAHGQDALLSMQAISGVFGMANPYAPIGGYENAWSFISEMRTVLATHYSMEAAKVYTGLVYNLGNLSMRPLSFSDLMDEIVATDVSDDWNDLTEAGVPVTLAQYRDDTVVVAEKNLVRLRDSASRQKFKGDIVELDGGHARPLLDPAHAAIIIEHSIKSDYQAAA